MKIRKYLSAIRAVVSSSVPALLGAALVAPGSAWAESPKEQTVEPTPEHADIAIQAAIDAAPAGGTVRLKEGGYCIDNTIMLTNDVRLIGAGVDKTVVYGSGSAICTNRGFTISHADAELAYLTVSNMYSSKVTKPGGAGIYMTKGTVRDCKITSCRTLTWAGNSQPGVGIYMTDGLLTGTEITDCIGAAYSGIGFGVWASGGTVTNCDIHANCGGYSASNANYGGATVYVESKALVTHTKIHHNTGHNNPGIYQTGGTILNTLVYNNRYSGSLHAGGLYKTNGKTYGCTFWGNGKGSDQTGASGLWQTNGDTRDCIFYANSPTEGESGQYGSVYVTGGTFATNVNELVITYAGQVGTIGADPKFKDALAADFRLLDRSSSAYGKAAPLEALTTDFAGRARGEKPSIGAYEYDSSGEKLDLLLSTTQVEYAPGASVTVEAILTGTEATPEIVWTVDGQLTAYSGYQVTITGLTGGRHVIAASTTVGETPLSNSLSVKFLVTEVYVNATGSGEFPYDTALRATNDVSAALKALYRAPSVENRVHVGTGTFQVSDTILISTPFRIEGEGADRSILCATSRTFTAVNATHASAFVADVAFSNFNRGVEMSAGIVTRCRMVLCGSPQYGGGAKVSGGRLHDCVIDSCSVYGTGYYNRGGGVYLSGSGVVSNVLITGCIHSGNTSSGHEIGGAGACVEGGTLTHARIIGSKAGSICNGSHIGLMVMKGTVRNSLICGSLPNPKSYDTTVLLQDGTIENCTFVDNGTNVADCVAVEVAGGTFVNSIVWRNGAGGDVTQAGGTVEYSCYSEATEGENGNIALDPKLKTRTDGRLVLRASSPAIDAAAERGWMTPEALDLYGNPRVKRDVPDMGCSEWQPVGMALIVK